MMVHGHPHSHTHAHGALHYSGYSPSDFDLLRALTATSSGSSNGHGKADGGSGKKRAGPVNTRRPQLDPLILETAASSGPHVTRNHFLHEFYPHPEDPSSSFSQVPLHLQPGRSARSRAYSSCDVGPESEAEAEAEAKAARVGSHNIRNDTASRPRFPRAVEDAAKEGATSADAPVSSNYQSRQAPRKLRLEREKHEQEERERLLQEIHHDPSPSSSAAHPASVPSSSGKMGPVDEEGVHAGDLHTSLRKLSPSPVLAKTLPVKQRRRSSLFHPDPVELPALLKAARPPSFHPTSTAAQHTSSSSPQASLQVVCQARTRVPTPHGEVFLHLYRNSSDDKEHLAFVFDRAQLAQDEAAVKEGREEPARGSLRSKTLDSVWRKGETDLERIVRGAYVGRLSSSSATPSSPASSPKDAGSHKGHGEGEREPVLIRVHSECFTGETIGSQRCDCGEQLDEAFRLIAASPSGLGVVVYLRQEGRGIGLLEKIKAYNLQDLGHDTVTANLLLGHSADMRTYGIAGEILRDLGVNSVKLLTNNPDKIDSVEKEGVRVTERVPMVPRGWNVPPMHLHSHGRHRHHHHTYEGELGNDHDGEKRKKPSKENGKVKRKPRNKQLDGLRQANAARSGRDTPRSQVVSSAGETSSDGEEAGSYEFPSAPGTPDPTAYANGDDDQSDSSASSSTSSFSREQAESDYLIAMNRTGVGMIGGGTTHSKELEKYLKTKIERMGHLLSVPNAPPSTPIGRTSSSSARKARSNRKKQQQREAGDEDGQLAESTASLDIKTDPESVRCGEGCEECGKDEDYEARSENLVGSPLLPQGSLSHTQ